MSNELMNLVWKSSVPSGPRLLLLALADKADRDGLCWPSRELLAAMTGYGTSTVSSHLAWLKARGFVTQRRGRQVSAVYTVVRSRLTWSQEVQNPDISTVDVQDLAFLNQDVQISEVLADETAGPARCSDSAPANQDVQNQDVLNPDLLNQDVQISDISKENPQIKNSRQHTPEHPDARNLVTRLAELMTARGCKPPTVSKRAIDEARRLFTIDHRPTSEAIAVLEWSQADPFWQDNIHSIEKFRKQYDQLRGKAQKAGALVPRAPRMNDRATAREWLLKQWANGAVAEITTLTGLRWEPPDLPLNVSDRDAAEAFLLERRKQWIKDNHELIISKLVKESAA